MAETSSCTLYHSFTFVWRDRPLVVGCLAGKLANRGHCLLPLQLCMAMWPCFGYWNINESAGRYFQEISLKEGFTFFCSFLLAKMWVWWLELRKMSQTSALRMLEAQERSLSVQLSWRHRTLDNLLTVGVFNVEGKKMSIFFQWFWVSCYT